jgi:hypothetical protein
MRDTAYRMKFALRKKFFFIPFIAAGVLALAGYVVMELWNNLLPAILHVGAITFWQAVGLFILCKILFGFGHGGGQWKRRRFEEAIDLKYKSMTPEEKEQFKQKIGDRMCGPRGRWGRRDWDWGNEKAPETEAPKTTE